MSTTPEMGLTEPTPGTGGTPGPTWAQELNSNFDIIDSHDHSSGKGAPLGTNSITIDADLPMNGFSILNAVKYYIANQASLLSGNGFLSMVSKELIWNDGSGNKVQITSNGGLNASSIGGIGGDYATSTASESYSSSTKVFSFTQSPGVPAKINSGDLIISDIAGAQTTTLHKANGGNTYTLNLPGSLPSGSAFVSCDSSGNLSFNASAVQYSHTWELNGSYGSLTYPLTFVDLVRFIPFNATITGVWIYNGTAGSAGTTEFDIKMASPGGSWTSVLSTTGKITSAAASNIWTDSDSIVTAQAGVTKPVINTTSLNAGQSLRFDLIQSMTGPVDCKITVVYQPR